MAYYSHNVAQFQGTGRHTGSDLPGRLESEIQVPCDLDQVTEALVLRTSVDGDGMTESHKIY